MDVNLISYKPNDILVISMPGHCSDRTVEQFKKALEGIGWDIKKNKVLVLENSVQLKVLRLEE